MEHINGFKAAVAAVLGGLTALWGWFGWLVLAWLLVCVARRRARPRRPPGRGSGRPRWQGTACGTSWEPWWPSWWPLSWTE